ncbi:nucleotidyltransferase family protein [Brasilonema sp. CT11]|nr:nucleotidyltransferase family protein [Brasilonema sp. CT11]
MQTLPRPYIRNFETNIRPEIELLLCCVRPQVDDAISDRIKALVKENIDWEYLIQTAHGHGVIPLIYTRLNAICPKALPDSALNQLHSLFSAITRRNLFLTRELVKLLELLKEQGIIAVPYKGPVLATLIYGNVALRQFGDLDIIVEVQDIFAVKKLLLDQGYRPNVEMTHAEEIAYLQAKTEHTYDFIHDDKGIFLEIHWRIAPKYITSIEPKHLWQDLEPFSLAGTTISYLPLEDWLPILCVHGSRHMWERLSWLCDIATLLHKHPDLNWEKVVKQATIFGCRRILFLGLFLAHDLLGVVLPTEIWQQVKAEPMVSAIAPRVYNQLFDQVRTSDRFMGRTLYHIQVRERFQDKVLYIQSFFHWLRNKNASV